VTEDTPEDVPEDVQALIDKITRLDRAYKIACYNITELTDQRNMLGEALSTATLLLDEALTTMRVANVTPSAQMIYTKANFDQAMKKLLGHARQDEKKDGDRD
jgi:hypothetical protein